MGSFEEKLTRKIHATFLFLCLYLNQRVRRIGAQNENLSRVFQKQKREKHMKRLSFYYGLPAVEKRLEKCLEAVSKK